MKYLLISSLALIVLTSFSACKAKDDTDKLIKDAKQSYENVTDEIKETVEDINNAAEEIKKASDAIKEAVE